MRHKRGNGRPEWVAAILREFPDLFPATDDVVWQDWVELKRREARDLAALVGSDVRLGLQARAIYILTVPAWEWNPFHWTHDTSSTSYLEVSSKSWVDRMPAELVPFYARIVMDYCDALAGYDPQRRWQTKPVTDAAGAMYILNNLLIHLLRQAPEDLLERIWERIQLNDPAVYYNMDDASGYNPYQSLMSSSLDERWKRRADQRMREIIRAELAGEAAPRAEHEGALKCYMSALHLVLYSDQLPYSLELFASQVRYLVELAETAEVGNFESWHINRLLDLLSRPEYDDLRLRVARFVVLGEHGEFDRFNVYDAETMAAARRMLDEFGEVDPRLAAALQELIAAGEARGRERDSGQQKAAQAESALHDRMR